MAHLRAITLPRLKRGSGVFLKYMRVPDQLRGTDTQIWCVIPWQNKSNKSSVNIKIRYPNWALTIGLDIIGNITE